MIQTPNLQLLPIERIHVEALLRSKNELAALLQVAVPNGWPHFPEAFSLSANESHAYTLLEADWGGYFFLHRKDRVLVGHGSFKGPPDGSGTVEIGYEIASEYWNRGLATEAAQGMIEYAFSHRGCERSSLTRWPRQTPPIGCCRKWACSSWLRWRIRMKAKYGDGRSRGMSINLLEPEHFVSLLVVSAKSRQVLGRRVSRSPINCLKSRRLSQFTVSHCCTFTATWFVLSSLLWLQRGEMRANEMADSEAVSIFQQKRDAYTSEGLARISQNGTYMLACGAA